jgi:hypothetical protein
VALGERRLKGFADKAQVFGLSGATNTPIAHMRPNFSR